MAKYYEKTKSNYSRDIDHLILFNKNGLWIKENIEKKQRIISATKIDNNNISNLNIFHIDSNSFLLEKIFSKRADISNNEWKLYDVIIFKPENGRLIKIKKDFYTIKSN